MTDFRELVDRPEQFLKDADPVARRLAVSSLAGRAEEPEVSRLLVELAAGDENPEVRAEAVEVLGGAGSMAFAVIMAATGDPESRVVEAAATAFGRLEDPAAVPWLIEAARSHADNLVKEAAVAALGAIGDEHAVAPLIDLVGEAPPQVRRRAVVALSVFDGETVEAALRGALDDRNPMVREAAEMVVGRTIGDEQWHPIELRPPGQ